MSKQSGLVLSFVKLLVVASIAVIGGILQAQVAFYNVGGPSRSNSIIIIEDDDVLEYVDDEAEWHDVQGTRLPVATDATDIERVVKSITNSSSSSFCVPWNNDNGATDDWWTHHVDWEVFHEDDSHFCFRPIADEAKARLFRRLYHNQFHGNCSKMVSRQMISSGWGADLTVVSDALMYAAASNGVPVQMQKEKWHYATPKPYSDENPSACPSQDMFCYFLPLSSCPAIPERHEPLFSYPSMSISNRLCCKTPNRWFLEFATRPQAWLRKRVYDFTKDQLILLQTPCTVLHVRRADVVLHDNMSRRYHAISEYMNVTSEIEDNILLLTDDHNAIGEALQEFPEKNWMFVNRTRHRGSSGGWERQLPSNDPIFEVTVILGTFRLVQQCSSMVKTIGNFGDFIFGSMLQANSSAWKVQLEDVQSGYKVYEEANSKTVNISRAFD